MKKSLGNDKRSLSQDFVWITNNGSAVISEGAPAIYEMDGSEDGQSAENASDSSAAKATSFLAGIALEDIAVGAKGKVQVRGYIDKVKLIRATRAATTDSYATQAAVAIGDQLIVNTVGNGMSRSGAGAASAAGPLVAAIGTLASAASQASTTSITSLQVTAEIDAFLRIM